MHMRLALIGLAAVVMTATLAAPVAQAQESFFNKRYCSMGGGNRGSGLADCGYNTWEQCRESASGLGRYCTENPNWRPETTGRGERKPRRKTVRQ
jgi:hypothetical protein